MFTLVPVRQPGVRRDRRGRRPGLHPRRPAGQPAASGLARRRAGLRRAVRDRVRLLPCRDRRVDGDADPRLSLAGGVVLLAGFVVAERHVRHPLLPLRVIVDRARGGSYVAVGVSGIAIFGTFLFLTFYLQVVKGDSPLTTGLLFLPMTGCILISSNLSSIIGLGPRGLIAGGMLLGAGGMALLTQVTVTSNYVSAVLPALRILGLGLGLIFTQVINTATAGVALEDSGVASALVNTMQQVGGSIGTSALSTIALSATASYLITHHASPLAPAIAATHGYTVAFGVSAGLLGLGFILAIVLLPSKRRLAELRSAAATAAQAAAEPAPAA